MNEVKLLNIGGVDQNIKDQYARDVIAPSENGLDSSTNLPVSSRHYDIGAYLIGQNRQYYVAIDEIDVGDEIVVGTNVRATTVSDELIALKNQSADTVIEIIADKEDGALATQSYTVGKYIYWAYGLTAGLYIVTADISSGDALVSGSGGNIAPANKVCDDIKELKENIITIEKSISNPNLIDNSWFTINQRGKTVYTPDHTDYHFLDRWLIENDPSGDVTCTINNDNTLTIVNNSNTDSKYISQQAFLGSGIELKESDILTLSVDVAAYTGTIQVVGGLHIVSPFNYWSYQFITKTGISTMLCQVTDSWLNTGSSSGRFRPITFILSKNSSITLRSVKLERGSISTLNNDSVPNYELELLKCQRYLIIPDLRANDFYYTPFQSNCDLKNTEGSTEYAYFGGVLFPVRMRIIPSITFICIKELYNRTTQVTSPGGMYCEPTRDGINYIRTSESSKYMVNGRYMFYFEANAEI